MFKSEPSRTKFSCIKPLCLKRISPDVAEHIL